MLKNKKARLSSHLRRLINELYEELSSKGQKYLRDLVLSALATQEHKTVVGVPDNASTTVVGTETLLAITATPHTEHEEAATRTGNDIHSHGHVCSLGLILILQTQLRTNFSRTQVESELKCTLADICIASTLLETQLSNGDIDEFDVLFVNAYHEGGFAEDVICPVADIISASLEGLADFFDVLERAEFDCFPGFPDMFLSFFNHLPTKKFLELSQEFPRLVVVQLCQKIVNDSEKAFLNSCYLNQHFSEHRVIHGQDPSFYSYRLIFEAELLQYKRESGVLWLNHSEKCLILKHFSL